LSVSITVDGTAYSVPSGAADTNWAAQQVAFEQAVAAAVNSALTSIGRINIGTFSEDSVATPGDVTTTACRGIAAFANGSSQVIIATPYCATTSVAFAQLQDANGTIATLRVLPQAGQLVVNANTAATATTPFVWWVAFT